MAILKHIDYRSALIFTRTKMGADVIARWLENSNHGKVGVLHSDRSQRERENALKDFKEGRSDILVATDIVARGIDITGVSHVINYDIPQHSGGLRAPDWPHRPGRTRRRCRDALQRLAKKIFSVASSVSSGRRSRRRNWRGFDYRWSPILDDSSPKKKKRNRSAAPDVAYRWQKR